MASVLQLLLKEKLTPGLLVTWLKNKSDIDSLPEDQIWTEKLRSEFIAYFLNFLRDQTLHLLQNARSTNPSPVKTPSSHRLEKSSQKRSNTGGKRVQLFSSPGDCARPDADGFSPLLSPNSESPHLQNPRYDQRKRWDGDTPNRRKSLGHTPDSQRTKQKLSLGEFILTPDSTSRKKGSPYSSREVSPSPTAPPHNRRSAGKRKGGSPLVRNNEELVKDKVDKNSPLFNLMTDFPPVGLAEEKKDKHDKSDMKNKVHKTPDSTSQPRRIKLTPVSKSVIDPKSSPFSRALEFTEDVSSSSRTDVSIGAHKQTSGKSYSDTHLNKPLNKQPRRITPIAVGVTTKKWSSHFGGGLSEAQASMGAMGDSSMSAEENLVEERELLRQEKARRQQMLKKDPCASPKGPAVVLDMPCVTPTKALLERKTSTVEYIQADLKLVTHAYELDIMADFYTRALSEHLFPNLTVELYFLTQLLTSAGEDVKDKSERKEESEVNYFVSVHNAVYFAVKILEKQTSILSRLDKSTLRFLSDNVRIAEFSSPLQEKLKQAYDSASTGKSLLSYPRSPIGGVSFQADTDNRKNFPNDRTFHQFKKQRDVFYEVIRDWEDKHQNTGWSLVEVYGERIRWLVNHRTDLTNHLHFARLFLSQLIVMCKGDKSVKSDGDDETATLLAQLKKTNPEKFKKLQERFIKPFSLGGPCPSPSFTGYQEFFRDFIIAAGNSVFNQHLSNTLVAKVTELNSTEFVAGSCPKTSTSSEADGEEDQQEMFASCLLTLRLLGKFLGFVTFLPYQTMEVLPDDLRSSYIIHRNRIPPPMNFVVVLQKAISCRRVVLTVPWLVEFASQMDTIAPVLDAYDNLLLTLLLVLRLSWQCVLADEGFYGNLMVVVLISWLLDTPVMPDGMFFKEPLEEELDSTEASEMQSGLPLDDLDLVSQDLLYACCPYVAEMRNLLMEFAVGTNSRGTVRKITPTAADTDKTVLYTHKQLQTQLEENFFHNHPASLKRTVEFVGERMASNFIKKFRSALLPQKLKELKAKASEMKAHLKELEPEKRKIGLEMEEILKMVPVAHEELMNFIHLQQKEFCRTKTLDTLRLLLPEEQSESVVNMAASISTQMAETRIVHWISTNVTKGVIQSELTGSSERLICTHLLIGAHNPPASTDTYSSDTSQHKENARALSDIISDLKEIVGSMVVDGCSKFELNKCLELLSETETTLDERQDYVPSAVKSLEQLVFNLVLYVVIHLPGDASSAVVDRCIVLWKGGLAKEVNLDSVCCNRVVHALSDARCPQLSWSEYGKFVVLLFQEKFLKAEVLEKGCRGVLKGYKSVKTHIEPLGYMVCDIVKHFQECEEITTPLCRTLAHIFHLSVEGSSLARTILPFLDKYLPLEAEEPEQTSELENSLDKDSVFRSPNEVLRVIPSSGDSDTITQELLKNCRLEDLKTDARSEKSQFLTTEEIKENISENLS